mgnify:CR=1 FL=1
MKIMKKMFVLITLLIMSLSCSSENEIEDNPNNSTIKGIGKFELNSNEKTTNYAYWYDFIDGATFSLKNVELTNQSEVYSDVSETVWFDLRPQKNQTIAEGTYRFSRTGQFDLYIQDGGYGGNNANNNDNFIDGNITIISNNSNYTINYELTLESGKNIKGSYIGAMNIVLD